MNLPKTPSVKSLKRIPEGLNSSVFVSLEFSTWEKMESGFHLLFVLS
jgi:hypothetical protein